MRAHGTALCFSLGVTLAAWEARGAVPTIEALAETTPIPFGENESDDSAVWISKLDPAQSLILGTSKSKEGGGLGVYALGGQQLAFFVGDRLNNVDISYDFFFASGPADLAVASNRSQRSLSLFKISAAGEVTPAGQAPLFAAPGEPIEPYGLCIAQLQGSKQPGISVFLPTKSGTVYQFALDPERLNEARLIKRFDLKAGLSAAADAFVQAIVLQEWTAEASGDLDELAESMEERYALEGCVFDPRSQKLLVGMENFGVWSVDPLSGAAEVLLQISGSATAPLPPGQARWSDDIEGMDLLVLGDRSYLLFSTQGLSEFSLFDLKEKGWRGNFKLTLGESDPVTETDGLALGQGALGPRFPAGVLVVHDDSNTDEAGQVLNANYKIASLDPVLKELGLAPASQKRKQPPRGG